MRCSICFARAALLRSRDHRAAGAHAEHGAAREQDRLCASKSPPGISAAIVSWSARGSSELAGFTVTHGTIVKIDLLADSTRPRRLDLTGLDD